MSQPLDELYLTWLYTQVGSVHISNPHKTHWGLLKKLFTTEFVWFVPNDDNRAKDGRALRQEFIEKHGIASVDDDWMQLGCSMLELLVALSRRAAFETGWPRKNWFWEMIDNLSLGDCTDDRPLPEHKIEDVLHRVIWRTYDEDGKGGLFPVPHARDMPTLELWYQLQRYMIEYYAY